MKNKIFKIDTIDASKIEDQHMFEFFIFLIDSKVNLKDIRWINLGNRKFYEREFILLLKLIISQFSEKKEHNMINPFKIWWKKPDESEELESKSM